MRGAARPRGRGRWFPALLLGGAAVAALAAAFLLVARQPRPPGEGPVVGRLYLAPDTARIGEPVRVTYEVRTPAGRTVSFGPRPADDSLWTWQEWAPVRAQATDAFVRHRLRAAALPFRTGPLELPAPRFRVAQPGAPQVTGSFGKATVFVRSVLPAEEESPEIRGLKPPLEPPWWARVPWLLLGVVAAAGLAVWWWWGWWRRRRRPPVERARQEAAAAAAVPAHQEALAALAALAEEKLPERGLWYEHQTRLTAIVRRFLERRFGSPQPGYTTRELCLHLAWRGLAGADLERLRALLRVADLAKFARSDPGLETARRHEAEARALVLAWAEPEGEGAAPEGGIPATGQDGTAGPAGPAGAASAERARAG